VAKCTFEGTILATAFGKEVRHTGRSRRLIIRWQIRSTVGTKQADVRTSQPRLPHCQSLIARMTAPVISMQDVMNATPVCLMVA
jgi:hypothetical protein